MPTLHPLFTDHAVIASRRPRILGVAAPGSQVTVTLAGATTQAAAGTDGRWQAEFPPLPAGGPHLLVARDSAGEVTARDILLGEVWLGSGQSNMEYTLGQTKDTEDDIAAANEPQLRLFTVERRSEASGPVAELAGRWVVSTPHEIGASSAVAYYFGRRMVAGTGLPFGLIVSAWGGSAISAWLPESCLNKRPEYQTFLAELELARTDTTPPDQVQQHEDPGISAEARDWSEPTLDDSAWQTLQVPGQWQNEGWGFNGAVWYRRSVEIPTDWVGQDLELALGVVDDCDHSFINGTLVGAMGVETPNWWATPRFHKVPAALVTSTTVHVAVRVFDVWGGGGIMGNARLQRFDRPDIAPISLGGRWRAKAELELPLRFPGGALEIAPSTLWNGMIHPLLGTTLSGFIWYQGESDTDRARIYQRLLTDLITLWRAAFDAPELPFGIVQLANFMERRTEPAEDPWANLREAQRRTALHLPACGLALAIDVGEADDIHPRYKKTVGERLALWALRTAYGRTEITYSGPLPAETWPTADGLRIRFTHAEGLRARGDALRGFEIAGADCVWVLADEATITDDSVFVSSARIPSPVAVCYAWRSNPETTLENAAGLPASPFRTDG
jgi:sialate O-acetylesterase